MEHRKVKNESHEQGIHLHVVMKVYSLGVDGMLSDGEQQDALCSLVIVVQLFFDDWLATWKNHLYHAGQQ